MYHSVSQMQPEQPVMAGGTLILTGSDVRRLLTMANCLDAVEEAFRQLGSSTATRPSVSSVRAAHGGYHIKSALFTLHRSEYFVSKTNANYPSNLAKHGLPTIQGTIVVHDAANGVPLAVLDSIEITAMRTAAASAIAAKYLARPDASTAAIIGCGLQGLQHVHALQQVRPLRAVCFYDSDPAAAARLAARVEAEMDLVVSVAPSVAEAVRAADLIATCTTSTDFLLDGAHVTPGAFIAGVGVDAEHKRELSPGLMRRSLVVVDVLEQCAAFGDLHHAIEAGAMTAGDVHAELGSIVAGTRPGRTSPDETFVFDSTGMALQDAATAAVVFERARAGGIGIAVNFQR